MRKVLGTVSLMLLACVGSAYAAGISASGMGTCVNGNPRDVFIVNATDADDCDQTPSGTAEAHCCCQDGVWARCGGGGSGSGDIESVWSDLSGDVSALVAAAGDSLDAGSADSSSPFTRSTSLPGTCTEGNVHQDTDSGDGEAYICIGGNVWKKWLVLDSIDTSSELRTILTDEIGTGALVFVGGSATGFFGSGLVDTARLGSGTANSTSFLRGDQTWATTSSTFAPYDQYDPDKPSTNCFGGTGAVCEEWTGNTAAQTWTWSNQDSATETIGYDSTLITGDTAADEIRIRSVAAPANADQTWTVKMHLVNTTAATDGCAIGAIVGGTQATPTDVEILQYIDAATDQFLFFQDTNLLPAAGATVHGTGIITWGVNTLLLLPVWVQIRYVDSSRATSAWISWDGIDFPFQVGTTATAGGDPVGWFIGARDGGVCRFFSARLRTDANRNDTSD